MIADVVAAQPRRTPLSIPDKVPGVDFDADLATEGAGIINIRSVYDLDGVASVNIAAVADPVQTPPANRSARFLRIEKAVAIPDEDTVDLDNTAFGPNIQQGMREVIGYAPIEPDGSVRVKVPANVALAISVLDANGRRTSARHQNWLQVAPGQELTCNGCHVPTTNVSHGRSTAFNAAYAGATSTGVPFPNTVGTFSPDAGETMAETRTRVSCQTDCAALEPSVESCTPTSGRTRRSRRRRRRSPICTRTSRRRRRRTSTASPTGRRRAASSSTTRRTSTRCGTRRARSPVIGLGRIFPPPRPFSDMERRTLTAVLLGIASRYRVGLVHQHHGYRIRDAMGLVHRRQIPWVVSFHGHDAPRMPASGRGTSTARSA